MKLNRIVLLNFLSHSETYFDLQDRNPVILVGDNGAGKSALARESVNWAFYGRVRGEKKTDEVIKEGEDTAEVCVAFELDGKDYHVVRQARKKGKRTSLQLFESDRDISEATVPETQKKIERVLGMDYETFTCTACIEQGKANSFSILTPKEAKRILMEILQLGQYDKYLGKTREEAGKIMADVTSKDLQVQNHAEVIVDLEKSVEKLSDEAGEDLDSLKKQVETAKRGLEDAERALAEVNVDLSKLAVTHGAISGEIADLKKMISSYQSRMKSVNDAKAKHGKCPLCLTSLTDDSTKIILSAYQRELGGYGEKLVAAQVRYKELQEKDAEGRKWMLKHTSDKNYFQNAISSAMDKIVIAQREVGALREKERQIQEHREKVQRLTEEINERRARATEYSILEKAFDKHGIPTLIIENVIPEIGVMANQVLSILSDGSMSVSLQTQRELKGGGVGDALDIVIQVFTQTRTYGMLSDGQRFRVDLALRIALSSVLARRNNFKCQTLIIDEGFGSLDVVGRQQFVELSKLLENTFSRLVIITHTDLTEYFENLVVVRLENGSSKVIT